MQETQYDCPPTNETISNSTLFNSTLMNATEDLEMVISLISITIQDPSYTVVIIDILIAIDPLQQMPLEMEVIHSNPKCHNSFLQSTLIIIEDMEPSLLPHHEPCHDHHNCNCHDHH